MNHPTIQTQQSALTNTPITPKLLEKFDVPGPRYTSYPTADRFVEAFSIEAYEQALLQRNVGGIAMPLSLYIHIPFCESLCFYCACNKIVTKRHERAAEYLRYLEKEIDLQVAKLGAGQAVSQLHFGGGSPTFFNDDELESLMALLRKNFHFSANGEYSIEIDPRTVDATRLAHLKKIGFNRLSFGVQDFDPDVQKAVHRIQPAEQVFDLVACARSLGFKSINVDLIYGLPKQTTESFSRTLAQIVALKPDRIALYAYAHLPARFKPQRRILAEELPPAQSKLAMLSNAILEFLTAQYVYVGMDHFALPQDELAIAKRQGRLHRNFQGYSTQPDCDILALGVSSIGRIGSNYSQNAKTLDEYYDSLNRGQLPVVRGLSLSRDDLIRRAVIMGIMCQGRIQYESVETAYLIQFKQYFSKECTALIALTNAGMIEMDEEGFNVTNVGWYFVRAVAMVFDRYLQTDLDRARFSKII